MSVLPIGFCVLNDSMCVAKPNTYNHSLPAIAELRSKVRADIEEKIEQTFFAIAQCLMNVIQIVLPVLPVKSPNSGSTGNALINSFAFMFASFHLNISTP
jgi:hypothetical protein